MKRKEEIKNNENARIENKTTEIMMKVNKWGIRENIKNRERRSRIRENKEIKENHIKENQNKEKW